MLTVTHAAPPSDVYIYAQMSWSVTDYMDATLASFFEFNKEAPRYMIDQINNSSLTLPNTTLHYVVEDHGDDAIRSIQMLDSFLASAIYPVVLVDISSINDDTVVHGASYANAKGLLSGTAVNSDNVFANPKLFPNFIQSVRIFKFFL